MILEVSSKDVGERMRPRLSALRNEKNGNENKDSEARDKIEKKRKEKKGEKV